MGVVDFMQDFLLGTYTREDSKGIYQISLNRKEKKLENLQLIAEVESPTFLDTSENNQMMFAVVNDENGGGVASFKKTDDGQYEEVDRLTGSGAAPCYVFYDDANNFLYTANYHHGKVGLYQATSEGELESLDVATHHGSSSHPNQDAPHAHYIAPTPDGQFVLACDLGTDEVITYRVENNKLVKKNVFDTPAGTGPRHLVFHPSLDLLYVLGELSSEVLVLNYDAQTGEMSEKQIVTMLPEDFNGENSGAAIRLSSDGKFLYASNRGHNSIVVYQIDAEKGTLDSIQWQETFGKTPRDFNLDESEEFVIAGHQHQPVLTLFARNQTTGFLSVVEKDVYAPEVVCVQGLTSS